MSVKARKRKGGMIDTNMPLTTTEECVYRWTRGAKAGHSVSRKQDLKFSSRTRSALIFDFQSRASLALPRICCLPCSCPSPPSLDGSARLSTTSSLRTPGITDRIRHSYDFRPLLSNGSPPLCPESPSRGLDSSLRVTTLTGFVPTRIRNGFPAKWILTNSAC